MPERRKSLLFRRNMPESAESGYMRCTRYPRFPTARPPKSWEAPNVSSKKTWVKKLEKDTGAAEEDWEVMSTSIFGRPWPESAVILEANEWKRWTAYREDHDGHKRKIMQAFYMTWKAQDYQCLDDEQNTSCQWLAKLKRKLIEIHTRVEPV